MAIPVGYNIYLTDAEQVQSLQTTYPTGIQVPPNVAAATYNVPIQDTFAPTAVGCITIQAPGGYWINRTDFLAASYGSQTFSATFTDPSPPWVPGWGPSPYPVTLDFYWVGYFIAVGAPGASNPNPTVPRYLGARRWANGFEVPTQGEGGSGQGQHNARDASRTPEGYGYAYRSTVNDVRTMTCPASTRISWERFYIRLRTLPTGGDENIWGAKGSVDGGMGILLNVNTSGTLEGYFKGNAAYPGQSAGSTAALTIGTWYRIDLRLEFKTGTPTASLSVYVNGTLAFSGTGTNNSSGQNHERSQVGGDVSTTSRGLEADVDDWNNAAEVSVTDATGTHLFSGNDLTCGSHMFLVRPTGFGSGHHASYVGNYRAVNNNPANTSGTTVGVQSSTPATLLQVTTDFESQQFGCAAISMGAFPFQVGGGAGALRLNALSSTVTHAASTWSGVQAIYTVPSLTTTEAIPDIGTVTLGYLSGPTAGINQVVGLFATAEMIGIFGAEDDPSASPSVNVRKVGIHNGPYSRLNINSSTVGPVEAVRVASGIYTGNDLGQDVFSQIPAHWWFVRPLTGSNNGVVWFSSTEAAHKQLARIFRPEAMPQARLDSSGFPQMQVAGTSADDNANAVSYQWIAVSDIGMRFFINGAFSHKSTLASAVNALIDSGFTPDAAFFFLENYSSALTGHYYKGPGHLTNFASPLDAAEVANIATFGAGVINSLQTPMHTDVPQTAFSAWRKLDGTGAPQWMDITSYVGNGGGARSIPVALNGTSPFFAIVVPHTGGSYFRDPSHTGTNSNIFGGAASATAITGGSANTLTVGVTLNTNLVVYDVFVLGGATTAFTNGAGTVAVETQRTGGPWAANPAQVSVNPVVLNVPPQWRIHRFDMKPRREERS